ncbi:MAG: ABC transporter permease DevC [Syntrophales bacterium]|nr:ABC transporter permease DevC [Syntrophales bacterium]
MRRRLRSMLHLLFPLGIPLAWLQLIGEKKRFLTAIAGVTFAVTLMMYQLGTYFAVLTKVVFPHMALQGELVLTSKDYNNFYSQIPFSLRQLYQAQGLPEVESVAPLYIDFAVMKNPATLESKKIFVLGVDPSRNPFHFPEVSRHPEWLTIDEYAFYDTLSQKEFGPIAAMLKSQGEVLTEVGGMRMRIQDVFHLGGTISAAGHLLVGERAFFRIFPGRPPHMISLGMIRLKPGADPVSVAQRLGKTMPPGVRVWTREAWIAAEKTYWEERSPIAFIFLGSMLVALIVGAVIVYQILYTDVSDHLQEYATLKAIGVPDRYFSRLVIQEALILLAAGFIPGLMLTGVLYHLTRVKAALPIYLSLNILVTVFVLSLIMCVTAGMLALRRLHSADPADIF